MPDEDSACESNVGPFKEEDFADDSDKDILDEDAFNIPPKDRKLMPFQVGFYAE
jgi:hypothetical protein